ncbi:hypothetical protein H4R18_001634 [Coemansia javaensis]|uniref:MARVEL domain-containing protein n=1 Tax=Coemansia javaensis TaxID=2761396 RepID=A0A9W8LK01_9FUNG|nr:hypothetical protein H4R18_001634 [Coemansia javaensis]
MANNSGSYGAYSGAKPKSYADAVRADNAGGPSNDNSDGGRQATVDITSMGHPQYQPYAGAYSESAGRATGAPPDNRLSVVISKRNSLASNGDSLAYHKATTTKSEKIRSSVSDGGGGGAVGMRDMDTWHATRLVCYLALRVAQLVVVLVCIGFQADARNKRPGGRAGATESNTEIATIVLAGVSAAMALFSILMHMFAKTRRSLDSARVAWPMAVVNFAIFVTWIVLVLINVVAVDCSTAADGSWCRSAKAALATGLISAALSLAVTVRSLSVLIRAKKVRL